MKKLSRVQQEVYAALKRHGSWSRGCGWMWDTYNGTRCIMNTLVNKGYATSMEVQGGVKILYRPIDPPPDDSRKVDDRLSLSELRGGVHGPGDQRDNQSVAWDPEAVAEVLVDIAEAAMAFVASQGDRTEPEWGDLTLALSRIRDPRRTLPKYKRFVLGKRLQ